MYKLLNQPKHYDMKTFENDYKSLSWAIFKPKGVYLTLIILNAANLFSVRPN